LARDQYAQLEGLDSRLRPLASWWVDHADDVGLSDGATVLYSLEHLLERNNTYEIQASLPNFLMIGKEGDLAYVLESKAGASVYAVDLGSLSREDFRLIAPSFAVWEQEGFKIPQEEPYRLPLEADVYVSGLGSSDLTTLNQLRRFLNADWPMGTFRDLLANQPFLAVSHGFPIKIENQLVARPDLAPFLFFDSGNGLERIAIITPDGISHETSQS
jgi:hypothetical protein